MQEDLVVCAWASNRRLEIIAERETVAVCKSNRGDLLVDCDRPAFQASGHLETATEGDFRSSGALP